MEVLSREKVIIEFIYEKTHSYKNNAILIPLDNELTFAKIYDTGRMVLEDRKSVV